MTCRGVSACQETEARKNTYRVFKTNIPPDEGVAEGLAIWDGYLVPRRRDDEDWALHSEEDILLLRRLSCQYKL